MDRDVKKTLLSAEGDLGRGDYNWACFKAHQAAGYAVKALLHGLGLTPKGHSISLLLHNILLRLSRVLTYSSITYHGS